MTISVNSHFFSISRSALEILEIEVRGSIDQEPKGPVPECQVVSILLSTLLSSLTDDANIHRNRCLIP